MDAIKQDIESRKYKLVNMLKFESEGLALERQHQIYGAIKELDLVLGMIMEYGNNKSTEISLKSVDRQELMNKLSRKLR